MAESSDIEDAARTFSLIQPDCVAYACTSASFVRGIGYDAEIAKRIQGTCGSKATTTSTAIVAALRALQIRRLAVAAPYVSETCEHLRRFFENSGFEIVSLRNLGLRGMEIGAVSGEQVYAFAKRVMTNEAKGLLIPCTAFPSVEILDTLERDLGKPVVSANQATMWHALRIAGIHAQLEGLGRLYRLQRLAFQGGVGATGDPNRG